MTPHRFVVTVALMLTLLYCTSWQWLTPTPETGIALDLSTAWRQYAAYGDAEAYLQLAMNRSAGPPYGYRLVPITLAKWVTIVTHDPALAYLLFNSLCFVIVGAGTTWYAIDCYYMDYPTALLTGVLAVTGVTMQSTLLFPMIDPPALVAALGIVWTTHRRSMVAFVIVSVLAVLTKELFIVATPIWILVTLSDWLRSRRIVDRSTPSGGFASV